MSESMLTECTICLLDYKEETKTETECNHIFHQECLDTWLQTNYTCPLCRTELKPKNSLHRPIYALPSEQQHLRYNSSRINPAILDLSIGIMTAPGYNAEDSIVFGREIIDEGLISSLEISNRDVQLLQESGMTLRRRENAHELMQYQRMMMDLIRGHDVIRARSLYETLPSNSIVSSDEIIDYDSPSSDENVEEEMYTPYSLGGDLYDEDAYAREVGLYM